MFSYRCNNVEWIYIDGIVHGYNLVLNVMLVFEYYIWERKYGSCVATVDVCDIGMSLEKLKPRGKTICEEGGCQY